jgi:hypothetical protein
MQKANRLWSARGYVPPSARKAATRVDLALRPDLPARMRTERERVLVDQRWFRMLQFERLGSINSSWSLWCETYRRRLGIQAASWAEQWSKPFLAERHLRHTIHLDLFRRLPEQHAVVPSVVETEFHDSSRAVLSLRAIRAAPSST